MYQSPAPPTRARTCAWCDRRPPAKGEVAVCVVCRRMMERAAPPSLKDVPVWRDPRTVSVFHWRGCAVVAQDWRDGPSYHLVPVRPKGARPLLEVFRHLPVPVYDFDRRVEGFTRPQARKVKRMFERFFPLECSAEVPVTGRDGKRRRVKFAAAKEA